MRTGRKLGLAGGHFCEGAGSDEAKKTFLLLFCFCTEPETEKFL